MTSEITYAEVRFKNESKSSGTKSEPPAAPKEKTSPYKSNPGFSKALFLSLLILLLLLAISFFIAFIIFFQKYSHLLKEKKTVKEFTHTALDCMKENLTMEDKNWNESEKNCSGMKAHLLVINTKAEQEFITGKLDKNWAYFVGLSDPEGTGHWQWVDQTPYNQSATFWHPGEPSSHPDERCAALNARWQNWGLNDIPCGESHRSICKVMKIYL
ncbi:C-type lectin domain family 4 member A isoform X2 [Rhinolophus ferrumequinum]|uniref:C-type lectin domain family 4 member A isoform X2 n=1 Tax=Rhinolophus ferrumequinum TaxID=59479 RepID=UPI00140FDD34|nr:C-type lectin domain family 4 member A isoform X2 [Rhinolophus ferrumequinum]